MYYKYIPTLFVIALLSFFSCKKDSEQLPVSRKDSVITIEAREGFLFTKRYLGMNGLVKSTKDDEVVPIVTNELGQLHLHTNLSDGESLDLFVNKLELGTYNLGNSSFASVYFNNSQEEFSSLSIYDDVAHRMKWLIGAPAYEFKMWNYFKEGYISINEIDEIKKTISGNYHVVVRNAGKETSKELAGSFNKVKYTDIVKFDTHFDFTYGNQRYTSTTPTAKIENNKIIIHSFFSNNLQLDITIPSAREGSYSFRWKAAICNIIGPSWVNSSLSNHETSGYITISKIDYGKNTVSGFVHVLLGYQDYQEVLYNGSFEIPFSTINSNTFGTITATIDGNDFGPNTVYSIIDNGSHYFSSINNLTNKIMLIKIPVNATPGIYKSGNDESVGIKFIGLYNGTATVERVVIIESYDDASRSIKGRFYCNGLGSMGKSVDYEGKFDFKF